VKLSLAENRGANRSTGPVSMDVWRNVADDSDSNRGKKCMPLGIMYAKLKTIGKQGFETWKTKGER
jgi:hypothetical protein